MAEMITISGLSEVYKWMDDQSNEVVVENTLKSMRKAMSEASKIVRRNTPSRWKKLTRGKTSLIDGKVVGTFGYFNGKQVSGHQSNEEKPTYDWFKMYWNNYGTLTRRDTNHEFINPVRHSGTQQAKRRRNRVGIPPRHYFEKAIEGAMDKAVEVFLDEMDKNL